MKRRLLLALVALLLMVAAAAVRPRRLATPGERSTSLPPQVALASVALGGLNGLIVDLLWLRASQQQDQGQYFDMLQTADWIAALQPRLGGLYYFQAQNMAFNIAGEFHSPEDRWRWVQSGLSLLLNEGLRRNPNDPEIYLSIAMIIDAKVGEDTDPAYESYLRWWADEWYWLLGGPRPQFDLMAKAPDLAQLQRNVEVKTLLDESKRAGADLLGSFYAYDHPRAKPPPKVKKLFGMEAWAPALRQLQLHARSKRLHEVWHMPIGRIRAVDQAFGPFDWRAPEAHVVYWTTLACEKAGGRGRKLSAERLLSQALRRAVQKGRLVYRPGTKTLERTPDLKVLPSCEREFERIIGFFPDAESFVAARRNLAMDAILALYMFGDEQEAERRWRSFRWQGPAAGNLRAFVLTAAGYKYGGSREEIKQYIEGILGSMWRLVALGDRSQAEGLEKLARLAHAQYQEAAGDSPERRLPEFVDMEVDYLNACLNSGDLDAPTKAALLKATEPLREQARKSGRSRGTP